MDLLILNHFILDLQLFANPQDEGRTEDPSERKKREKREEGQVAKSPELVSAGVFLVSFIFLCFSFKWLMQNVMTLMHTYFANLEHNIIKGHFADALNFLLFFWKVIGPLLMVSVLAAIILNIVQVGFLITPKAISPKLERISFSFKKLRERILFSKPVMLNLLYSVGRVVLLATLFYFMIHNNIKDLLNLTNMGLEKSIILVLTIVVKLFIVGGVFLVIIGIPDYLSKRKQFKESLMITKSDARREMKQEEGDPHVKGYLKEMYHKMLQKQSIKTRVPEADVIITNPTHFAIALKYNMDSMDFPMVVAKGEDETALLIREIAKENNIEIIENPPLARELYKLVNVGDYIPEHLTMIIAEIFVQLYKKGKWNMDETVLEQGA